MGLFSKSKPVVQEVAEAARERALADAKIKQAERNRVEAVRLLDLTRKLNANKGKFISAYTGANWMQASIERYDGIIMAVDGEWVRIGDKATTISRLRVEKIFDEVEP